MKILVLNCGSSSIKSSLYDLKNTSTPLWEARIQWKNTFDHPRLFIKRANGIEHSQVVKEKNHKAALKQLIPLLYRGPFAVLKSLDEVEAIGHRIVHGGSIFKKSTLITSVVKKKLQSLSKLAPLHNRFELEAVTILETLFKKTPQIAVFDTAFHTTLPNAAKIYPGPYKWVQEGIVRYGFHGTSFAYCIERASTFNLHKGKTVICHLGSGASLCAVQDGKSIDTTMGFTPLDGLMMDTRSGSIDPGILLYLLKKKTAAQISQELNYKSGLLGIFGKSSDMKDVIDASRKKNPRALLALELYVHRLNACIGSMIASLKGLDTLIFTAGIGENAPLIREMVSDNFAFLGLKLDKKKNQINSQEDRILSTKESKIKVVVIHTKEELKIAYECKESLNG